MKPLDSSKSDLVPPPGLHAEHDVALAPLTTIGIGGSARWLVRPNSESQLRDCLLWCAESGESPLVLGGGSNVLISDSGWPGLVIHNAVSGLQFQSDGDAVIASAGGGIIWDDFVAATVSANLQGIECLSGIPGTVGASPVQNIGAYGQEVKDTIMRVDVIDRSNGEIIRFTGEECGFAYRWSRFKGEDRDRYVVTRVAFRLRRNGTPELRYGDLTRYFEDREIATPTLAQVRDAVIEVRAAKGMVISPDIPDSKSCGSFFMNPIVSASKADDIYRIAIESERISPSDKMPRFPAPDSQVKLSAAWLMEKSGLSKGQTHGNVGLSSRHVLAIINRGGGTAVEVIDFAREIQGRVNDAFGVDLHPEPVFVGFSLDEMTGRGA